MEFNQPLYDYVVASAKSFEESLDLRPVTPTEDAERALKYFDEPLADKGSEPLDVIKMLNEVGEPGVVSSRGGRYYGFVTGAAMPVSVAANWLAATWDQNAGPYVLSPTAAVVEEVAGNWVLDLLRLPLESGFGFVTGATMASFTALSAARLSLYRKSGYDLKADGIRNAPKIRFVMSEEIHPTIIIGLQYMGYGKNEFEFVPVDDQGRMIAEKLPMLDDMSIVICQAGNVNSGSFDPFEAICAKAKEAGAWVHVDGAFGGWIRASKSRSHLADGMDKADSWSVDCHKWLNIPHDSAIAIVRDKRALQETFGVVAPYLVTGEKRDPDHYTPELSRRARGIEVWAALKHLGRDGMGDLLDRCCNHAKVFASELANMGFTILNDVVINQIVVTMDDESKLDGFIERVQQSGKTWFGPTNWKGRKGFRISVSSYVTTDQDVKIALKAIEDALN